MSDEELTSSYIKERTRDFTGRSWVFAALQAWLSNPPGNYFYLTGGPGSGKSAIAARLVQMSRGEAHSDSWPLLGEGCLAHFHFCRTANEDALNPLTFVRQLSLSLCRQGDFARALAAVNDPAITIKSKVQTGTVQAGAQVSGVVIEELSIGRMPIRSAFDQLVRQPLKSMVAAGFERTLLILVDALDEALTYDPDDNIALLLAEFLDDPSDLLGVVRFILTSRPDPRLRSRFGSGDLDLIANAPPDVDDVRLYAVARLKEQEEPLKSDLANRLSESSEGSFLYARYVLDDLLARPELPENLGTLELPAGLEEIYRGFIRRELGRSLEAWGERYRPILELLAVARDPGLNRDQLSAATGLPESSVDQILAAAAQYLQGASPEGPFSLYHQSFREYLLTNTDYPVYPGEAHQTLGELFLGAYHEDWADCQDGYAIRNTPGHLLAAAAALTNPLKRSQQRKLLSLMTDLLGDFDYIHARLSYDGNNSASLERDFKSILEVLPTGDEGAFVQAIGDALQRESHIFRADPGAFYIHFYNRLYRGDGGRIDRSLSASSLAPKTSWLRALHPLPVDPALKRTLAGHTETVTSVTVYQNGRSLVSASSDKTFRLWNLETGDQLAIWSAPPLPPGDDQGSDLDLSGYLQKVLADPDGRWFILRSMDDQVQIWDAIKKQASGLALSGVLDMVLTPERKGLLVTKTYGFVELFHLESRRVVHQWQPEGGQPAVIAISPQGDRAAVGGNEGCVWVWDLDLSEQTVSDVEEPGPVPLAGRQLNISQAGLPQNGEDGFEMTSVVALAFSDDGRQLVVGDDDGGLSLWNLETFSPIWARWADSNALNAVAISSEAGLVLSGGVDTRLRVWDLATGELQAELRGHTGQVMDIAILEGGRRAVTAGGAGTIRVWDLDPARLKRGGLWHSAAVNTACVSPDGKLALSGGEDGRVLLWDVAAGRVLEQREIQSARPISVALFGQQDSFLAGDEAGVVHRWRPGQDQPVARIDPDVSGEIEMKVVALADLPGGLTAISLSFSEDQAVIWRADENSDCQAILHIQGDYNVGTLSRDASRALLAYDRISYWRAERPQELEHFAESLEAVQKIAFTASGLLAAAGDLYGNIVVWDLETLRARWLVGHTNYVQALALSPDGRWLLSGGWDKLLRLWDLSTGKVIARYLWELPITSCDLHASGDKLKMIVGDKQGNVLFFVVNNLV